MVPAKTQSDDPQIAKPAAANKNVSEECRSGEKWIKGRQCKETVGEARRHFLLILLRTQLSERSGRAPHNHK